MHGNNVTILITFMATLCPQMGLTQEPENASYHAEELLLRDETTEIPAEAFENQLDLISRPINLNSATTDQLIETGFFTPFQVQSLISYRKEFGPLYSVYELAGLTGFRGFPIREIAPYLIIEAQHSLKPYHSGREIILITASRIFPESTGYQTRESTMGLPAYTGTPFRTNIRIRKNFGTDISMGISYDKDPGEKCLNGLRPEFVSGYLSYRGTRAIKQVILGDFKLHHGLGLANGSGFMNLSGNHPFERISLSKLKPYASLSENLFEQGIAGRIGLQNLEMLLWTSFKTLDLSLRDAGEMTADTDWSNFQRTSGFHRTSVEMNGRFMGYRIHTGFQAVVRHGKMAAGIMVGTAASGLTQKGIDSLKIGQVPYINNLLSLHWQWQIHRIELFGEVAVQNMNSLAILSGIKLHFNDFFQGALLAHHYGTNYQGFRPLSYASGSIIRNESGLAASIHMEPGRLITADFLAELFNYPSPRFQTNVPTSGWRSSLSVSNIETQQVKWTFRIVKKKWQSMSPPEKNGIRQLGNNMSTRVDFRTTVETDASLSWHSRFLVTLLTSNDKSTAGYAFVQRLGLHPLKSLNLRAQFVVFHVPDFENRIFLYEPGMYYSFSFPVYYGTGQKVTSVVSFKTGRRMTLSASSSVITYHDRKELGSGNDLLAGNKKWDVGVQIRINL